MAYASLLEEAKELERQVGGILSTYDIGDLPAVERDLATKLKHQLIDARLDVQEYEYAQAREQQLKAARAGRKRLDALQETIVKASEYNLFGAVDVAQLSARAQKIISRLE